MTESRTVRQAAQYSIWISDGLRDELAFVSHTLLDDLADEWDVTKAEAARESLQRYGQVLEGRR